MTYNNFSAHPVRILGEAMVSNVHSHSLRLLERVGVKLESSEALALLEAYGVRCDRMHQRIYPDEDCIERALKTVSRDYSVFGRQRDGALSLRIDMNNSYTISGGAAIKLGDGEHYTEASLDDLVRITLLHDRLEHIDIVINVVEPVSSPGYSFYPYLAAVLFSNTGKPLLLQAGGREDLKKLIQMGSLFAGGTAELQKRPLFMTGTNAEPPLRITEPAAEVMIDAARVNIPCSLGCYAMAGSTSPFDVLSSLVQRVAVVLCGLVLTQAARAGSSYGFSCHTGCCDLRTGDVITMSPMAMQLIAGSVQMGRYYNLTTNALSGTESKRADGQAAAERMFSLATCLMAGASMVHGSTAQMSGMELADYAQCVIDNEIAGFLFDFIKEIDPGELDQSVDTIADVEILEEYKHLGFLGHPTTVKHCRTRRYSHDLFSSGMLSRWLAGDRRELVEKAKERVRHLLSEPSHVVPEDLQRELYAIAKGNSQ